MENLIKSKIVRAVILVTAMILGMYFVGNAQVLSCDDKPGLLQFILTY